MYVCVFPFFFFKTLSDKMLEWRINIQFLVKLKKNTTEIYRMLHQAYGEIFFGLSGFRCMEAHYKEQNILYGN
jgi:hypothetical protein